ncbi:hypothetical protein VVD49_10640 [Uliginosibacterium sp. H3]|uniref:Uncharacterized protein n=1 Tax=Uliginosibacterium silvisoli TaxID=3114758 RepID=A0ABU6K3C1_9RHOO|nr:hypothetical protein [Uliginosibacterium sp. H3]
MGSETTLYYAFGGGLGHLTRARAVRHTLDLRGDFVVLSAAASPHAAPAEHWLAPAGIENDIPAFRAWIIESIQRFQPQRLFVDAFPAGILGELCDFPWPAGLDLVHVARILRWDNYAGLIRGALPRYVHCWQLEELSAEHHRTLDAISARIAPLTLEDPAEASHGDDLHAITRRWVALGKPVWLIVHAGPDTETAELLAYARECAATEQVAPHFAVVSPGIPLPGEPDIERIDLQPARTLFPFTARIVTACGFNSMRQAAAWRERHLCMPFARRFDDQFLRRKRFLENQ